MIHHDYVNYVPEYRKRILRRMKIVAYMKALVGAVTIGICLYLFNMLIYVVM